MRSQLKLCFCPSLLLIYRLLVEKLPTGMLITSSNVQTVHLFNSQNGYDIFLLCFGLILIPLTLYYTIEEFMEMYRLRFSYCTKLWNLIDLSIAVVSLFI